MSDTCLVLARLPNASTHNQRWSCFGCVDRLEGGLTIRTDMHFLLRAVVYYPLRPCHRQYGVYFRLRHRCVFVSSYMAQMLPFWLYTQAPDLRATVFSTVALRSLPRNFSIVQVFADCPGLWPEKFSFIYPRPRYQVTYLSPPYLHWAPLHHFSIVPFQKETEEMFPFHLSNPRCI